MQPTVILLGLLAIALFVGTLFVASMGGRALRRALGHLVLALRKPARVSELASGPCRLEGHAFPSAEALVAPISGRSAVWFELAIARETYALASDRKAVPAVLRDESGEIELELGAARLELPATRRWRGTLSHELPAGIDAALRLRMLTAARGVEEKTGLPREGVTLELEERAVYVGQSLHVCGSVVRTGSVVSFISTEPVAISDRPFSEMARRDGVSTVICLGIAFAVVGVLTAVGSAILARV